LRGLDKKEKSGSKSELEFSAEEGDWKLNFPSPGGRTSVLDEAAPESYGLSPTEADEKEEP